MSYIRHRDGFFGFIYIALLNNLSWVSYNKKGMLFMNIQEMILTLQTYWSRQNCILMQSYDTEKGAGTMSPMTLLRSLGPEPWNVAYVEPSRRPADGRYGQNPNRLYQHHQFQV